MCYLLVLSGAIFQATSTLLAVAQTPPCTSAQPWGGEGLLHLKNINNSTSKVVIGNHSYEDITHPNLEEEVMLS